MLNCLYPKNMVWINFDLYWPSGCRKGSDLLLMYIQCFVFISIWTVVWFFPLCKRMIKVVWDTLKYLKG